MVTEPKPVASEQPAVDNHVDVGSVRPLKDRLDRPSPFGVQWRVDGKRSKMFFEKHGDRDKKLADLQRAAKRGVLAFVPSRDDLKDWVAFKRAIGNTPWQDVVAGWKTSKHGPACTMLAGAAADDYYEFQETRSARHEIGLSTLGHQRVMLAKFKDAFKGQVLSDLTGRMTDRCLLSVAFKKSSAQTPL